MIKDSAAGSDVILQIENVNRTYYDNSDNHVEALQNINLSVRRGEFLSLIGSSGCGKTTLLLLDEPMGALDSFTRADIQDKLLELRKENDTTMILVTHDVDEAIYLSDRIVVMTPRPGKINEIMEVRLPHPRNRGGSEFLSLRRSILEKLQLAGALPQPEYTI